jgi:hypothetical protein
MRVQHKVERYREEEGREEEEALRKRRAIHQ